MVSEVEYAVVTMRKAGDGHPSSRYPEFSRDTGMMTRPIDGLSANGLDC